MKRIILSLVVMAFAVAVQADDAKTCQVKDKDKPACCPSKVQTSAAACKDKEQAGCCPSKVKTSVEAKGNCPFDKSAGCKQAPAKQTALVSPKAATEASQ